MGALSSWAMLALTHHLVVQLAYRQSGIPVNVKHLFHYKDCPGWYTNYELLGDDIVIFDKGVADAYLILMQRLGVEINLSKSVIAQNKAFEFAKVTGFNGVNVSALP
jgi:hypothetical protein